MPRAWTVHFQPIVDLASNQVVAAEALLRPASGVHDAAWLAEMVAAMEGRGGASPPGIHTHDVIAHALAASAGWPVEVGVNVAPSALGDDVVRVVAGADNATGRRRGVCVEVTESQPLGADALAAVVGLAGLGARIALDDFGTGVRTLADLRDFPVDVVKIDARFVRGLGRNHDDTVVVDHLIRLARGLGLETVAEGVESTLQHRLLMELGCDRGQGWLWSPALPAGEFEGLLQSLPIRPPVRA